MKRALLASVAASVLLAGPALADKITVGITQNNVGVDSYQTTYEKAFIAAADADPDVDAVVLDHIHQLRG